jgi:uncharacterized membrane protein required for colicin V production
MYPDLSQLLKTQFHLSNTPSTIISFILIWVSIFLIIRVIGIVLDKIIEFSGLSIFNRLGGLVLGVVKGGCFLIPIIIPLFLLKPAVVDNSKILNQFLPVIISVTKSVIPSQN